MSPEQAIRELCRILWDKRWHTSSELYHAVEGAPIMDRALREMVDRFGLEIILCDDNELAFRLPK